MKRKDSNSSIRILSDQGKQQLLQTSVNTQFYRILTLLPTGGLFGPRHQTVSHKGPCNIYCITGPMQNHFWNQKSQDPRCHKQAKIIGPCQYVYEKSVGPVGACLCAMGHCLIQLRVWRAL